jgi:IS30 family transposase
MGSISKQGGNMMVNRKHLNIHDRNRIYSGLNQRQSLKKIAFSIDVSPSTVSREVRSHMFALKKGAKYSRFFNDCVYRSTCTKKYLCDDMNCIKESCSLCNKCNSICKDYKREICPLKQKPPYVCNGCKHIVTCQLEKRFYESMQAQKQYEEVLRETRKGIAIDEGELQYLNDLICPLLKKGQSFHHIYVTHKDEITVDERSLYNYTKRHLFDIDNLAYPRLVRFKKRINTKHSQLKVDKKCYIGRSYDDFKEYLSNNPDTPIVEIDSVEGNKGGKVLLTIHFVQCSLMLAFIRDRNTSRSVIDVFNGLYAKLGYKEYIKIFPVLLGDRGQEFSNPQAIEVGPDGRKRSKVFFCNTMCSFQKGSIECTHEFIRRFIPKYKSFENLNQEKVNRMMDNINSYKRAKLGDKSAYEIFKAMFGEKTIKKLGINFIPADEVIIRPSVIK